MLRYLVYPTIAIASATVLSHPFLVTIFGAAFTIMCVIETVNANMWEYKDGPMDALWDFFAPTAYFAIALFAAPYWQPARGFTPATIELMMSWWPWFYGCVITCLVIFYLRLFNHRWNLENERRKKG